jgi:predicted extracellular nuclease
MNKKYLKLIILPVSFFIVTVAINVFYGSDIPENDNIYASNEGGEEAVSNASLSGLSTEVHQDFRVMFYNVENLFDTYDNPRTRDNDFLPEGKMRWTPGRYYKHLRKTAQVINATGELGVTAICGLCEVENDSVLIHLLNRTPLKEQYYRYCITTGSDLRGINNALLYQRDKFKYRGHRSIKIQFSNKNKRSRDILHVRGEVINGETLNIFVCHFPSRAGGEEKTSQERIEAATTLRIVCDSVFLSDPDANIIVMGDFNDTPKDKSIQLIKKGKESMFDLVNLFEDNKKLNFNGTYKYRGEWSQLDQILVSRNIHKYIVEDSPRIFAPDFLLTKKNRYGEQTPFRKYSGTEYKGGFSDHLPVVADFLLPLR